jgi:hypothetical protein
MPPNPLASLEVPSVSGVPIGRSPPRSAANLGGRSPRTAPGGPDHGCRRVRAAVALACGQVLGQDPRVAGRQWAVAGRHCVVVWAIPRRSQGPWRAPVGTDEVSAACLLPSAYPTAGSDQGRCRQARLGDSRPEYAIIRSCRHACPLVRGAPLTPPPPKDRPGTAAARGFQAPRSRD